VLAFWKAAPLGGRLINWCQYLLAPPKAAVSSYANSAQNHGGTLNSFQEQAMAAFFQAMTQK
jgi:hypothetical protein